MNTGAPRPDLEEAESRVLAMQTKLHHSATADPDRRAEGLNTWRAGCEETRTSGSEGGPEKPTRCKLGRALRSDPYTRLLGPTKWTYYYLYVLLDVFSRYVVGWTVAARELAAIAEPLIAESCARQQIQPGQLTVHADRGAAMISKPVALLLADLGVTKTHSRPHVSNDNPFSESQFKTMKYRPDFPDRFGSIEHARQHGQDFFPWYNTEHHHVGLGLFTPHDVHYGLAAAKREQRARVLADAFARHPERFPNGSPMPRPLPTEVWINPPKASALVEQAENTMTLESDPPAIEAVRATLEADPGRARPVTPDLILEDRCMAPAQ